VGGDAVLVCCRSKQYDVSLFASSVCAEQWQVHLTALNHKGHCVPGSVQKATTSLVFSSTWSMTAFCVQLISANLVAQHTRRT
jgi:poly(3-hydroxybutyrate) depolymerase